MKKLGVTESYKLKRQVVLSASEAAEMIIRYATSFLLLLTNTDEYCLLVLMISCGLHLGDVKRYR
jgi:hypothetical protein